MKTTAFTKTYGERVVLSLPELELQRGQITAIIGPNGSGKSTLAKVLAGIERADNNRSILPGVSVGYLPQKSFPFRMSTEKNILQNGNDPARARALVILSMKAPLYLSVNHLQVSYQYIIPQSTRKRNNLAAFRGIKREAAMRLPFCQYFSCRDTLS